MEIESLINNDLYTVEYKLDKILVILKKLKEGNKV